MFHCILHLIPVEQLIIIVVAMHNCTIDSKMESVTLYDKCVTLVAYKVQKGCVGVEKMGSGSVCVTIAGQLFFILYHLVKGH